MTDNEIIKALEVCCDADEAVTCSYCPYKEYKGEGFCIDQMCKDALNLINRQKAEIERLQTEKEILIKTYKKCMTEAIKEFADQLKEYQWETASGFKVIDVGDIDDFAKEMIEREEQ